MSIDIEIGEAGSIGCMEQFGGLREVDQFLSSLLPAHSPLGCR